MLQLLPDRLMTSRACCAAVRPSGSALFVVPFAALARRRRPPHVSIPTSANAPPPTTDSRLSTNDRSTPVDTDSSTLSPTVPLFAQLPSRAFSLARDRSLGPQEQFRKLGPYSNATASRLGRATAQCSSGGSGRSEGRNLRAKRKSERTRCVSLIGLLLQTKYRALLYMDMMPMDKYERPSVANGREQIGRGRP